MILVLSTANFRTCSTVITAHALNTRKCNSFLSATGCDSIINLDVTIDQIDLTIFNQDPFLQVPCIAESYQWLDCNNNFAPIAGETSDSFLPTANGFYVCEITNGSCTDTTFCVPVTMVGVEDIPLSDRLKVYPNPTNRLLNLEWNDLQVTYFDLFDLQGRRIMHTKPGNGRYTTKAHVPVDHLPAGVYLLRVKSTQGFIEEKVIIK